MITLDQVKIILKEAPVGKDGTILPNKKDSKRDKELTKRNIQKYSKQTELKLGNAKTTNVPLSTKRTLKGRPLGSMTTKKPKVIQPTIGVNQAEVSKKAREFTDKVNKARTDKISDKIDKEVKRRIRQAGGSGDFSPTMPTDKRKKAQAKRDARIKALDTPDPFTTPKSKKPIRPFGDKPVTTGIDKPVTPKKTFKSFRQDTKIKTIQDIRSSDRRLYDTGKFPDKKPSLVQQRKDAKARVKAFNAQQARKFRAYADLSPDGDTGAQFKEVKPKPVQLKGSDKKISKKAIPQITRPTTTPAVTGTYSNVGRGRRDDVSKFVSKVQSQKKRKSTTFDQDALNQAQTGVGPDGEYLTKDQRRAKFSQSKGETSGGSSGGSNKPPSGGGRSGGGSSSGGGGKPPGGGIPPTDPPKTPKSTFKFNTKDFKTRYKQYKSSYYKPGRIAKRVAKLARKKPGLATLALAGTAIGVDYLRRRFFNSKQLDRNKDFKSFELKSKSGKSLTDPSYIKSLKAIKDPNEREKQLKINRNLTDITKTKLSNDAFKQMAPGGRLTGGSGSSVYKFVTQNPRYRSKVEKTVKDRGFRVDKKTGYYSGDPYGILSKKS